MDPKTTPRCNWFFLVFLLLVISPVQALQTGGTEDNPFALMFDEGPFEVLAGQSHNFEVTFQIPPQYYLYSEKMAIEVEVPDGIATGALVKPQDTPKDDPFFGHTVPVYFNEVTLTLPLTMPPEPWVGAKNVKGVIQFQGCSTELCYRMLRVPFAIRFLAKGGDTSFPGETKNQQDKNFLDRIMDFVHIQNFTDIAAHGIWFAILICFIAGFLTDFTPCVWPLVPVTLAIIGVRKDQSIFKNFVSSLVLVSGMAVMYSVLGLLAAWFGRSFGFLFQHVAFLIFLDILLVLMALSLFGFYQIQLPSGWQTKLSKISASGYRGIFFIGLTMGFLAAPCVGPVVGPLLVFVAETRDLLSGFILMLSYALGMGILFLILGTLYGVLKLKIKSGPWMEWFKKGLGVLILLVAVYYGRTIVAQIKPAASLGEDYWQASLGEGIKKAGEEGKPLVVDFFAEWCPPCFELDRHVWRDEEIRRKIRSDWIAVKIDCTTETKTCKEAVDRFSVIGWPTVVFLDSSQEEVGGERLVGRVVSPDEMLQILSRVH